jgi:vancomycin resistance protein VanJ
VRAYLFSGLLAGLRFVFALVVSLYSLLIAAWLGLHSWFGDTIWWLGLVNAFAPLLFTPLLLLLPLALLRRSRSVLVALLLPVLTFAWLYGEQFLPAWPIRSVDQPPPLTILTFNVWSSSHKADAIVQVLQANNMPDLVALQELTPWVANKLPGLLEQQYPYHLFVDTQTGRGLGVLSRYPLQKVRSAHFPLATTVIQIVQVQAGERTLLLYNIHPLSSSIFLERPLSPIRNDTVLRTFEARLAFVNKLVADVQTHSEPVIVVGDFNSADQSDVHAAATQVLVDAHEQAGWGFGHTFPAELRFVYRLFAPARLTRIDMILYTKRDFVALRSYVSPQHAESDHLPVVATLAWRK